VDTANAAARAGQEGGDGLGGGGFGFPAPRWLAGRHPKMEARPFGSGDAGVICVCVSTSREDREDEGRHLRR
jgi:hypothetical protein